MKPMKDVTIAKKLYASISGPDMLDAARRASRGPATALPMVTADVAAAAAAMMGAGAAPVIAPTHATNMRSETSMPPRMAAHTCTHHNNK